MALQKLTAADLELLATDNLPLLSALPDRPRNAALPAARAHKRTRAVPRSSRAVPRRLRRYYNDVNLAMNAASSGALPTTPAELAALFQPRSRSEFDTLFGDIEVRAAWESFMSADDVAERAGRRRERASQAGGHQALPRVDSRLRQLIKQRGALVRPLVEQFEKQVMALPAGQSVRLVLESPFSRLVAHGVASFHLMKHNSFDVGDQRVTVISATNPSHQVRLLDVVA
ncbi:R3H domain containing protein [Gracilaria domingensis]|nr:R3H domain containing protein [Gracilaria domingensis]